jgi:hypothetical protein
MVVQCGFKSPSPVSGVDAFVNEELKAVQGTSSCFGRVSSLLSLVHC